MSEPSQFPEPQNGMFLSLTRALLMEAELAANPDQAGHRLSLITFYSIHLNMSYAVEGLVRHMDWLIKNSSDSADLNLALTLPKAINPTGYSQLKESWLEQVHRQPENVPLLSNAARFFQFDDRELAEDFLLRARQLRPDDPTLTLQIANLYRLGTISKRESKKQEASEPFVRAWQELEECTRKLTDEPKLFYVMTSLVETAADAGEMERAEEVARQLLDKADYFKDDWNYGNAIFHANHALATAAFARNEVSKASEFLVKASETPGSPQLDSFGPRFDLAKKLLDSGERQVVKKYIDNCGKFWEMSMGCCEKWSQAIDNGDSPSLNPFDRLEDMSFKAMMAQAKNRFPGKEKDRD